MVQPLLRGFGPAVNRRFIHIARNNLETTDLLFRQQLIATVYGTVRLYEDLVSLGEDVKVKEETLALAQRLGPEALEWFHERERVLNEKLKALPQRPYSFHVANIFPNFALVGVGSAFYGKGLILHHPRGPNRTEACGC